MADVSPNIEAEKERVVRENESHSPCPQDIADRELKELEKEHYKSDVSAGLESPSGEQSSSQNNKYGFTCSSPEEHSENTNISTEHIKESSSNIKLSSEEPKVDEPEVKKTSEIDAEFVSPTEDVQDDELNVQDIRTITEENKIYGISIDNNQEAKTEGASKSDEPGKLQSQYHIKWTKWKGLNTPIITQNENGPCPLIAIINALILQRKISIPSMQQIITTNQLMEYLGDCIFVQAPERLPEGAQLNYEQNMHDAIGIMSKLQTGLDVNVKFTGVTDFEFTSECVVFDLLNIKLMHGWLVDPQNEETVKAINSLSYNQLVEKIIASKQDGAKTELVSEGIVAETFLDSTATQLTYHGLCELNQQIGEEEPCVFFRNNHFNTLYKHKNELFLLVTDQGFLTEEKVMWETLSNVEGDGYFVDANFKTLPTSQPAAVHTPVPNTGASQCLSPTSGISQEDQDYLVALTLQEEQSRTEARETEARETEARERVASNTLPITQQSQQPGMTSQEWSDMQLALQLQEEEKQRQEQLHQGRPAVNSVARGPLATAERPPGPHVNMTPQPQSGTAHQSSNDKCMIL